MGYIYDKISDESILDSEIIQEMECAKKDSIFDINFIQDGNIWTLLMCAVYHDRKELVEYIFLMYPSINVNHRSIINGDTALYWCNQVSILKLLLDRKDLDVNMQNIWGSTGLHNFCIDGRKAYVKELLLDARVDTSICDNQGKTALYIALEQGYHRIAKMVGNSGYTTLLRIPNRALLYDIIRMIIEEYT